MTENPVDHFADGTQFRIFFHSESQKLSRKFLVEVIEGAMMDGVISGPGLIGSETKYTQEATEISLPFLIGTKALMAAIMENRENTDPE